jgi:hypothetical protein
MIFIKIKRYNLQAIVPTELLVERITAPNLQQQSRDINYFSFPNGLCEYSGLQEYTNKRKNTFTKYVSEKSNRERKTNYTKLIQNMFFKLDFFENKSIL